MAYRCMENAGYTPRYTFCEPGDRIKNCALGKKDAPDRSVEKRLNSRFCKKFTQADICQPDWGLPAN